MNEENKIELFSIVSKGVVEQGLESVVRKIQACNMGNLDGSLVTNENLHLFRQFRNGVSSNAHALVYDAINWATKYLYLPKEQERELSVKRTEMYMSEEYSHCK